MPAGRRGWEDSLAQLRMQKTWLLSWLLFLIVRRCLGFPIAAPENLTRMRDRENAWGRLAWVRGGTQGSQESAALS